MEIFCSVSQHILLLLNHFPSFNSWPPPPPLLLTVCYSGSGIAHCWQETSAVKQAELTPHLLCLRFTLLQKRVEWVRLRHVSFKHPPATPVPSVSSPPRPRDTVTSVTQLKVWFLLYGELSCKLPIAKCWSWCSVKGSGANLMTK